MAAPASPVAHNRAYIQVHIHIPALACFPAQS
jgi:hypothetical protein